jgi:serine/threonine-protein kinase
MAQERDILAVLEHPNIARLYDAGVTSTGRPYLALEYVDGMQLDKYSRAHALTLRQRLDLFLQIARAVAFAHARLIVHRDLKPSNVLVTAAGDVRLLDFGVARLLQFDAGAAAHHTQYNLRAFTPRYAAPEQFTGRPITAATDVYSLGVLLYELLTGASPYAPRRDSQGALEDAVLDEEPALASSVQSAPDRGALRGDLDSILAKALRKAPSERYPSVEGLIADIERHRAGQPIAARPASAAYLFTKFARRNAVTIATTGTVVAALAIGLGIALWQWQGANRQRALATHRLAQTRATLDVTRAILTEGLQRNETLTLDQLLARSEAIAVEAGRSDREARIAATDFISGWYLTYGLTDKAERFLTQTIAAIPESQARAGLICKRAVIWSHQGRTQEAIAELGAQISRYADDPETAAYCLQRRGWVARDVNDAKGNLAFALEALRRFDEAGGQSPSDKALLLGDIGYAYSLNGQQDLAQACYEQALTMYERAGRRESVDAVITLATSGVAATNAGNPLRALELFDEALAITKRRAPSEDSPALTSLNRAITLRTLARYDEAWTALEAAGEVARRTGAKDFEASSLSTRADIARQLGHLDEAQRLLDAAAVKLREGNEPAESPIALRQRAFQAQVWAAQGRFDEATASLTGVFNTYTRLGCCAGARSRTLLQRAEVALARDQLDTALADAQQALQLAKSTQGRAPYSNFTGNAWLAIGRIREAQGRNMEARAAFEAASAQLLHTVGAQHPDTLFAQNASQALLSGDTVRVSRR